MSDTIEIHDEVLARLAKQVQHSYLLLDRMSCREDGKDMIQTMLDFCTAGERHLVNRLDAALLRRGKRMQGLTEVLCGDLSIVVSPAADGFGFLSVTPRKIN